MSDGTRGDLNGMANPLDERRFDFWIDILWLWALGRTEYDESTQHERKTGFTCTGAPEPEGPPGIPFVRGGQRLDCRGWSIGRVGYVWRRERERGGEVLQVKIKNEE